jgi:uncharacterized protein (TIGR00255 family)
VLRLQSPNRRKLDTPARAGCHHGMKSMTGFGRGECEAKGLRYAVEISTVNRRNAEIVINLPRELAAMENAVREIIAPAVSRGRATVTASVSGGSRTRPLVDTEVFRRIHTELLHAQRSLKIPGQPSLSDVIHLYAATARESSAPSTPDASAVGKAARAALQSLEAMRSKEGAHLARELQRLLDKFAKQTAAIAKLAPSVTARHREAIASCRSKRRPVAVWRCEGLPKALRSGGSTV